MDRPVRKYLPHDIPPWVDTAKEIYFLTVNCHQRGVNQLATDALAPAILDTVRFRQHQGLWFAHLFLLMPDHVHGLVSFPPSDRRVQSVVSDWKRWTSRQLGVVWQSDFFEHRIRQEENLRQKADYVLLNPVRAGLVSRPEDWPHVILGGTLMHVR